MNSPRLTLAGLLVAVAAAGCVLKETRRPLVATIAPALAADSATIRSASSPTENFEVDANAAAHSPLTPKRERDLKALIERWAASDPVMALAWLGGLREDYLEQNLRVIAVLAWARTAPRAALDYASGLNLREYQYTGLDARIIRAWAGESWEPAWNLLPSVRAGPQRDLVIRVALLMRADSAPAEALAEASRIWPRATGGRRRQDVVGLFAGLIARLARDDSAAAWAAIAEWSTEPAYPALLRGMISSSSYWHPDFAGELLGVFPAEHVRRDHQTRFECDGFFYETIRHVVARNPRAAAGWAAKLPDGAMRRLAYSQVRSSGVLLDPTVARVMLDQTSGGPVRNREFESIEEFARRAANGPASDGPSSTHPKTPAVSPEPTSEVEREAEAALKRPAGPARDKAIADILSRWPAHDRMRAFAWAGRLEDRPLREAANGQLRADWARAEPRAAFDYSWNRPGLRSVSAAEGAIRTWASLAPRDAFDYVRNLPSADRPQEAFTLILTIWAQTDPAAALQAARSLPSGADSRNRRPIPTINIIESLVYRLAENDPSAARRFALDQSEESERLRLLQAVESVLARRDPSMALSIFLELPADRITHESLANRFKELIPADPAASRTWAARLPDAAMRSFARQTLAEVLSTTDPLAALEERAMIPPGAARQAATRAIAENWGRTDFQTARHWAESLPDPEERGDTLKHVAVGWSRLDPRAALEWLAALPDSDESSFGVFHRWAWKKPTEAWRWMRAQPPSALQEKALRLSMSNYRFPSEADARKFFGELSTERLRLAAVQAVANFLAAENPEAAIEWAEALLEPDVRARALGIVGTVWLRSDPRAALWVGTLPLDEIRSGLIVQNVEFLPIEWAEWLIASLPDATARDRAAEEYFQLWMLRDSPRAIDWVEALDWPEPKKRQLLSSAASFRDPRPIID